MQFDSHFIERDAVSIGLSYAKTLQDWHDRFLADWPNIQALGFDDEFKRKWVYYLLYCKAGFLSRNIDNYQITYEKTSTKQHV